MQRLFLSLVIGAIGCGSAASVDGGGSDGGSLDGAAAMDGASGDGGTTTDDGGAEADAASASDGGDCQCISGELSWGYVGGHTPIQRRSSVTPCSTYGFSEMNLSTGGTTTCTSELSCQPRALLALPDVLFALGNEDVQAALSEHPTIYGCDDRPVDGAIFEIDVFGILLSLGSPCDADTTCSTTGDGCVPIPEGVATLGTLLRQLTDQEMASCH